MKMERIGKRLAAGSLLALAACTDPFLSPEPEAPAPTKVAPVAPEPVVVAPKEPSARSLELAAYYSKVETSLVGQGLMRTDGGGPDTPITDTTLIQNFEAIAIREEYERGAGLRPSSSSTGRIKKWAKPVRVSVEFGASVSDDQKAREKGTVSRYVSRLARVTGHSISMSDANANFHVLVMGEDDRNQMLPRIQELVPDIDRASLSVFQTLPRSIHCLVIAFSDQPGGYAYGQAIALIRAEHPPLLMKSCIHEEIAQGLGLANDSPRARPSIFNDDDEFALLTTHDEYLLKILYDPALTPGMTPEQAMPIVRRLAPELTGDQIASVGPS
ncbi:MAG: DUF2927 domain-containing protein [Thalassococcus sp.]|uniref:DUF2927 domain-containing protein n=1 Tax=Thalassococcus sp. TaxID=1928858 RepID=UPI001B1EF06C|nr:DUF2927 domain-containing protein [Thalassococcus sp.]MBO6867497.1 DUF2927 domain-containing protein [Thalassococcus sp.]